MVSSIYVEKPPSQLQDIHLRARAGTKKLPQNAASFALSFLPILNWIRRYNLTWFLGDVVAGITVGLVAIPQGISYATKLAGLPAQFGLYTAFLGAFLYTFFATSKDVTIGATAVLSLVVGQQLATYASGASATQLAVFSATLSFWTGILQLVIGVFRIGHIVDFVPVPVIAGFTSGAGIQIIIQQAPGLLGEKGVNTNNPPYQVLREFFVTLGNGGANGATSYDAAFGVSALALILLIKYGAQFGAKRLPWLRFVGYLRNAVVLVLFTGISYAVRDKKLNFAIVKTIPSGLSGILQGDYSLPYAAIVFKALPAVLMVAILEHIAVTKTYGRVNGYKVEANQEIAALGIMNLFGSFVGAIPATGSFSRSAIKSASGVRSPFASFITGIVVLICLYSLTGAMYYIPSAVLSAIVMTAISELVNFSVVVPTFKIELLDFVGFWVAFWVVFFSSIENSIYASVGYSVLVLLIRIARPKISTLVRTSDGIWLEAETAHYYAADDKVVDAPDGILVFKIDESLSYPNSGYFLQLLNEAVYSRFSYSGPVLSNAEKLWADDADERARRHNGKWLPPLKGVVFDFSASSRVDFTGLQTFLDAKADLKRYTGRDVPFHFAFVRPQQINTLVRVNGPETAASFDGTPANPSRSHTGLSKNILKRKTAPAIDPNFNELRYFHASLDNAVSAALGDAEIPVAANFLPATSETSAEDGNRESVLVSLPNV
ncbi:sulfate transporter family-domain-containing protein [Chytriomyces sp. MP71]|nr:sulfate transporter family-domain-containing protein [Chytriomyces sp. MP71]